jgi:hypothetical protein
MRSLNSFQQIAHHMIEQDREKDQMLAAMEAMWQGDWQLPREIADLRWIHKVVSTDPHDALRAGVRVLSSVGPRVKVMPMGPGETNQAQTEQVERALSWLFHQANRRRQSSVLRDIVLSALLYDEVIAQVVYLPYQIEALKAAGANTRRLDMANRFGPFAILVRNPRHVHVRYSDWMPEAVLHKRVMPVDEVVEFWGKQAKKLQRSLKSEKVGSMRYASVYDYMDLDCRVVWAYLHEHGEVVMPAAGLEGEYSPVEIIREEHNLGFLPWVAKVGGTTLPDSSAHQRVPMLYSVYQAGQWETQNILETLLTSEVIAYASAPRIKVEGPTDGVEVDYGEPGRMAYVPPGHNLSLLSPPGLDTSLAEIANRFGERIGKSTVPRVLQTADYPSGTAFATLNLATQSGLKSLTPYQELAEQALADVFIQMLDWVAYVDKPVVVFAPSREKSGEQVLLDPSQIEVKDLYVEVELTADVPLDKVSRINAAATAVKELNYSRSRALEYVGENDPGVIMEEARQEELQALEHELEKRERSCLAEVQTRQLVEEASRQLEDSKRELAVGQLGALLKDPEFIQLLREMTHPESANADQKTVQPQGLDSGS